MDVVDGSVYGQKSEVSSSKRRRKEGRKGGREEERKRTDHGELRTRGTAVVSSLRFLLSGRVGGITLLIRRLLRGDSVLNGTGGGGDGFRHGVGFWEGVREGVVRLVGAFEAVEE